MRVSLVRGPRPAWELYGSLLTIFKHSLVVAFDFGPLDPGCAATVGFLLQHCFARLACASTADLVARVCIRHVRTQGTLLVYSLMHM